MGILHTFSMCVNFFIFSTIWMANFRNVSSSAVYFLNITLVHVEGINEIQTLDSVDKIEAR